MAAATTGTRDIFVEANGLRHHLIARGSPGAPVVMMVHGLTQQAHVFDAIATKLAAKHHVYCLDVRGRGETLLYRGNSSTCRPYRAGAARPSAAR